MSAYYNEGIQVIVGNGQNFPGTPRVSLIPFIQRAYDKGLLNFTTLPPGAIDFTEIQNIATNKLLGRSTAGSGVIEELTIGTGLSLSGGTLTSTVTASPPAGSDGQIQFNNSGAFGASSNLTYNSTTGVFELKRLDSTVAITLDSNGFFMSRAKLDPLTVAIGTNAGGVIANNSGSIAIGINSQRITTAHSNVTLGYHTFYSNIVGTRNVVLGTYGGESFTTGDRNTFVGNLSARFTTTGSNNVFIGSETGALSGTVNYNTFIGNYAGRNITGDYNIFIGESSGRAFTNWTVSNKLMIQPTSNDIALIGGDFSTRYVSINNDITALPAATFSIKGSGSTSASTSLLVQNSSGTELMRVRDNGLTTVNNPTSGASILKLNTAGSTYFDFSSNVAGYMSFSTNSRSDFRINNAYISSRTYGLNISMGSALEGSASAVVSVLSTTQGFLPPTMTTTQKNAIPSPVEGLIVYDLTLHKLCVYTGSAWETITSL